MIIIHVSVLEKNKSCHFGSFCCFIIVLCGGQASGIG